MDWVTPVMKEWYWLVIIGSIFALAFAPSFLKSKCPSCRKRAMRSVDIDDVTAARLGTDGLQPYTSFYRCEACAAKFLRERSGPLRDASEQRWEPVYATSNR